MEANSCEMKNVIPSSGTRLGAMLLDKIIDVINLA